MLTARTLARLAVAGTLVAAPGVARAALTTWEIDASHSSAQFAARHLMVSTVRGEFSKVSGTVQYDPEDLSKSSVEATIDATTVSTREEKRDAHLKSPDFFDVAKFPTFTFKSKKVEKGSEGKLKVTGDLTIHGVTKEVVLDIDGPTPEVAAFGGVRSGATATTKINRKDFGVNWNKALDGGGVVVGDEVPITIDVELVKKAPAAPATAGKPTK